MLWFNYLSAILDPLAMDEAMQKAMLNCGLNVCDNTSMSMFVHMLKFFENENHILHNGL